MRHYPERQTATRTANFDEFTDMIHALLKSAWGDDWGTFTEAFPNGVDPQNVKFPVITYMLKEKRPATIGKGDVREIKPRFRQEVINEPDSGEPRVVNIFAQLFDCDVVFEVWEENNKKVTELADRFEDFMMVYKGFFMENGVAQIIFQTMNNESENYKFREDIVCRKFVYLVRLEKQAVELSDTIDKVTGSVTVVHAIPDDSIDHEHESIKFN